MYIIILGAGQVGSTLAENLVNEHNDITIIDSDIKKLEELQNRLDIRTVHGPGSNPEIMSLAGAENADMLVAVTNSDETNLVACAIANKLFHIPTKIARVRSSHYLQHKDILFNDDGFAVDYPISPEQLVTDYIKRLIEYPSALQVLDFAEGKVQLVGIRSYFGGPLVGKPLDSLKIHMPNYQARVAAIYRGTRSIPLSGSTVIEIGDEVFFIAAAHHLRESMAALRRIENPYQRIMIVGGGHIGERLACSLEQQYQVKIIEQNAERARYLSETLNNAIVLHGNAADQNLLLSENIEYTDAFCALTNNDEVNILSCMQAKRMGVRQVMALINRPSYIDLIEGNNVDIVISPQQATISSILTHVRKGDIVRVYSLRRGAAEAIEIIAHGDYTTSKVVGRAIEEINLPKGTHLAAVVRGHKVILAEKSTVIETDDHIILFVVDKTHIQEVERLFQVNITFF